MKENYIEEFTSRRGYTSPRHASIIAGIGYASLFILAVFANFIVKEGLIVSGNAVESARNIMENTTLFRYGMVSFLLVFLIDVFVAWGLFILFRPVHGDLSLLAAWLRIVYTVFLGVALVFYFQALQLLEFSAGLENQAYAALEAFNSVWLIGLTAFGLHLVVLGGMIVKYRTAPIVLGIILIAAGTAYVIDTVAHTVLPDYQSVAGILMAIVAVPSVLAEGWFGIWLLVKGGKRKEG
ncbi:MAG: DUF4386 domain-containing protein [Spirochaetales bacterium]|nr:DUF4386 domain-containing protein [Spirochaetales bacterium]